MDWLPTGFIENGDAILLISGLLGLGFTAGISVRHVLGMLAHRKQEKDFDAHLQNLQEQLESCQQARDTLDQQLTTLNNSVSGSGLWLSQDLKRPADYLDKITSSIPILTIANLKGGVGKTTLSANLAAYFATRGKRVLTIDLDFQGSLSSLVQRVPHDQVYQSVPLVAGELTAGDLLSMAQPMRGVENARILSAKYDLARLENRVMVQWLTGRISKDVRYIIAEVLLDPDIQSAFDIIVIDAPPRLTTASVQALAASTHVLIPVILDNLSREAAANFLREIGDMRQIWPNLKIAGIVATMTYNKCSEGRELKPNEREQLGYLTNDIATIRARFQNLLTHDTILPVNTYIHDSVYISRGAQAGVAYIEQPGEVQPLFDNLGQELSQRLGL